MTLAASLVMSILDTLVRRDGRERRECVDHEPSHLDRTGEKLK